jgi:hypothetical protein
LDLEKAVEAEFRLLDLEEAEEQRECFQLAEIYGVV